MNRRMFIVAAMMILVLGMSFEVRAEEVAIIVNAKNPVGNLEMVQIRNYFLKEHLSWPNGEKVRSVDQRGNSRERRTFLSKVVDLNSDELEKFWISKRYEKGVAVPPKLGSDREVIEYVLSFEGAVGYVNSRNLGGSDSSQIKVIKRIPIP